MRKQLQFVASMGVGLEKQLHFLVYTLRAAHPAAGLAFPPSFA